MYKVSKAVLAGLTALVLSTGIARAVTLDFTGAGTSNNSAVSQSYGDTAKVDVSYSTLFGGNNWGINAAVSNPTVRYWATPVTPGEEDIFAWTTNRKLELRLTGRPYKQLTRVEFKIGPFPNVTRTASYRIYSTTGALLRSVVNLTVPSSGVIVALNVSVPGIVFQLGESQNVGLRWVKYDVRDTRVGAVPVPPALPLLASGVLGLGILKRRKKKQA